MNTEYENLINSLIKDGYLKTSEIIEAFKAIDRRDFMPEEYKKDAYVNAPLPIGFGQTISQPLTVAFMLELLGPRAGEKILDVGSGSGWQAALLACRVSGPRRGTIMTEAKNHRENISVNQRTHQRKSAIGHVVAIERIPELAEMAKTNISKYNFIEKGIAEIILGDGSKGYEQGAPYDKIIAGAAAYGTIPDAWKEQLKIGGRIVAPVGHSIFAIDKTGKDKYAEKEYFGFSFVPLVVEADKRG